MSNFDEVEHLIGSILKHAPRSATVPCVFQSRRRGSDSEYIAACPISSHLVSDHRCHRLLPSVKVPRRAIPQNRLLHLCQPIALSRPFRTDYITLSGNMYVGLPLYPSRAERLLGEDQAGPVGPFFIYSRYVGNGNQASIRNVPGTV